MARVVAERDVPDGRGGKRRERTVMYVCTFGPPKHLDRRVAAAVARLIESKGGDGTDNT